jgi:hypothetical protein
LEDPITTGGDFTDIGAEVIIDIVSVITHLCQSVDEAISTE